MSSRVNRNRVITLPDPAINVLASPSLLSPQILCASATPFGLDLTSSDDFRIQKFDSFKNPIHSLLRSGSDAPDVNELFLAADADRYLNIYDISEKKLVRTLVAGSGVVELDMSGSTAEPSDVLRQQLLCVVTKDGTVELFVQPFTESKQVNGDLKSSRKNLTKKASASVRLVSAESKSKQVPIVAASLQGPDLVVVSVEAGVDLAFQKVRWQDEGNGELLFEGTKEVVKVKSASTLNVATLNGVKDLGKSQVDESRTVVVNGGAGLTLPSDAIEISSSDSEGEEDEEQESADEAKPELDDEDEEHLDDASNGDSDEEMADADEKPQDNVEDAEMDNGAEPTFGELLASRHPHEISIASALQPDSSSTLTVKNGRPVIPSGMSLGTVLTQSLRTNDQNLLEACLHTLDIDIVRNTIQRLDSSLAGILLSKLAERLASRPGRYGNLITWVQWTCIAHGGAIASQPDVSSKIGTLYQVLTQRMNTFGPLQLLKGKLDMLEAQLTYRRQLAAHRPTRRDDHDEPGMIYIEGADNWDSDVEDEDLDETADRPAKRARAGTRDLGNILNDDEGSDDEDDADAENDEEDSEDDGDDDDEEDEDEDMIKLNGQQNGFLDVEAEVSSAEDSDPADDDNDQSSEVASSSGSDEESEVDEEDEEEDSEMDSFINDGSVDFERDDDTGIHIPGDGESDVDEDDALPVPKTEKVSKAKAKANSEPATKQKKMKRN